MKRLVLLAVFCIVVNSCYMFAPSGVQSYCYEIIPGERLASSNLTRTQTENLVKNDCYFLSFHLDLAEGVSERVGVQHLPKVFRVMPSNDLFKSLDNTKKVKSEFKNLYESFTESYSAKYPQDFHLERGYKFATILYDGEISLTANVEFAGYAAGVNLAPLFKEQLAKGDRLVPVVSNEKYNSDEAGAFLDIPLDYVSMMESYLILQIPLEGKMLTNEWVKFTLEIPVKVVMYLNWLDDRITDPNAPIPYREDVLRCEFTVDKCLTLK